MHAQSPLLYSCVVECCRLTRRHAYKHDPDAAVLLLVPHRRDIQEAVARVRSITPKAKGIVVQGLLSPSDIVKTTSAKRTIAVTSPSAFLRIDEPQITEFVKNLSLVVFDDLHLLDEQYELAAARILSIARPSRTRIVGLTASLNDSSNLATWLGVEPAWRYAFYPRDRGHTIPVAVKTFPLPHSATLLKTMVKPAYDIVKGAPAQTIIFVPSRGACRTVANDMVTQSGNEMDLNGFLSASREDVEPLLAQLRDTALFEPILHGIGYLIPGSHAADLRLVLELFASGLLRALIVPRESCWTLPVRASTVALMGAQYIRMTGEEGSDRRVVNYSQTELVKMQGLAVTSAGPIQGQSGNMFVMCQAEQAMLINRILTDGLPLESNLPVVIRRQSSTEAITAFGRMIKYRTPPPPPQINRRRVADLRKRDVMDLLGWTYFGTRLKANPTYYDLHQGTEGEEVSRLADEWFRGGADEFGPVPSPFTGTPSGSSGKMGSKADSKGVSSAPSVTTSQVPTLALDREASVGRVGEKDGERLSGEPAVADE